MYKNILIFFSFTYSCNTTQAIETQNNLSIQMEMDKRTIMDFTYMPKEFQDLTCLLAKAVSEYHNQKSITIPQIEAEEGLWDSICVNGKGLSPDEKQNQMQGNVGTGLVSGLLAMLIRTVWAPIAIFVYFEYVKREKNKGSLSGADQKQIDATRLILMNDDILTLIITAGTIVGIVATVYLSVLMQGPFKITKCMNRPRLIKYLIFFIITPICFCSIALILIQHLVFKIPSVGLSILGFATPHVLATAITAIGHYIMWSSTFNKNKELYIKKITDFSINFTGVKTGAKDGKENWQLKIVGKTEDGSLIEKYQATHVVERYI